MSNELNVSLRVQTQLDRARKEVQDFKAEIQGMGAAGSASAGAGTGVDAAAAREAAAALNEQAKATTNATAAKKENKKASDDAANAAEKEQQRLDSLVNTLTPGATAATKLKEAQEMLNSALERGAISQEQYTSLMESAHQRWDQGIKATEDEKRALENLNATLTPGADAVGKLKQAQDTLNASLAKGTITQEQHTRMMALAQQRWAGAGVTAKQTAAAMRMLPAQITDITTSMASGMPIWLVALQQGGQIKDSFGGITPAARAMAGAVSGTTLAVSGLAAGIGVLVAGYIAAQREESTLRESIIMSGNAAGVTMSALYGMAEATSAVAGTTGKAIDALGQLVSTGRVSRENLQQFAQTAVMMEVAIGRAVGDTVKEFEELGKAPLTASEKLNERYNYLTMAVYAQISALVEQGKAQEAANLAQNTYSEEMQRRSQEMIESLGWVESAWRNVGDAVSWVWDKIKDIGRPETTASILAKAQDDLAGMLAFQESVGGPENLAPGERNQISELREIIEKQTEILKQQEELARAKENQKKKTEDAAKADKELLALRERALSKEARLEKKLAEIRENAAKSSRKWSAEEIKALEDQARKDIMGSGGSSGAADAVRANLRVLQDSFKESDALLVRALEQGKISITDAYQQRLEALQSGIGAQRKALESELSAKGTSASRKVQIQAELKLLESSLRQSTAELDEWRLAQQRELDGLTVRLRVDVSSLTGEFDRAAIEQQLQERYRADYEAIGRNPDPAAQQANKERLDLLISAGAAQAEFNAKLQETQRLQSQLSVIEQAIRVQAEQGQISQIEAEARISQARASQVPVLQSIVAELRQIRDALPPEAVAAVDAMTDSIGQLENQVASATPVVVEMGTRLRNTVLDGVADAAANAVTNFTSLRDIAASTLRGIAADIVRSNIKRLLTEQFTVGGDGSSGSSGGILGAVFSGVKSIFGFSEGGHIRGPGTGTSDSIPALVDGRRPIRVSNDEYIQPQRAVRHYGLSFMEAVRTLQFPKPNPGYALGGLVQAHQQARFATGGRVSGAAGAAAGGTTVVPNVVLQITNTGTPQRVERQESNWDGKQLVTSIILADVRDGGPISRGLGVRGRR